jgi:hypothetical protein
VIDIDTYYINPEVEEFVKPFKLNFRKPYCPIKVYISTANPYNHWLQKLYNFYNKKEEQNG